MLQKMVYQTLADQLEIGEIEILYRKELLQFTMDDEQLLIAAASYIEKELKEIIDCFYQNLLKVPSLSIIIGDVATLNRLKRSLEQYVKQLFNGNYDLDYVNSRLRIGLVHKRVNISPNMYLSSMISLKHRIYEVLGDNIVEPLRLKSTKRALDKLLSFDEQLLFDTYFQGMLLDVKIARDQARANEKKFKMLVEERTRQLYELSNKDSLTNLWNRRYFIKLLTLEIEKSQISHLPFSLFYMDLNSFKLVNDYQGHSSGDQLLKEFSKYLLSICRNDDVIARIGGDEFVWLVPNICSEQATKIAERITLWKPTILCNVSIGVVCVEENFDALSPDLLLEQADRVMYESKNTNRLCSTWNVLIL